MIIHEMVQGSDEWFAARLGKVTGSNFSKAIGKPGATRTKYMEKLIAEIGSQEKEQGYSNAAMEWGTETEPLAREFYENINDCIVREVGFVEHNEHIGVSPDGLVGEDGLLEIKCPYSSTHVSYIINDRLPPVYKAQVQGQLWVTGRQWCDFVSYDPRYIPRPYWCVRVERDIDYSAMLCIKVGKFITEMKEIIEKINASPF